MQTFKKLSIATCLTLVALHHTQSDCMQYARNVWTRTRTALGYPVKAAPTPQQVQPAPENKRFSPAHAGDFENSFFPSLNTARTMKEQKKVANPFPRGFDFTNRPELYLGATYVTLTALIDPTILMLTSPQLAIYLGLMAKYSKNFRPASTDIFLNIRGAFKNTYRSKILKMSGDARREKALKGNNRIISDFDPADLPLDIINEPGSNGLTLLQQAIKEEKPSSTIATIIGYGGANPHFHAAGTLHPMEMALNAHRHKKVILALLNPYIIKSEYKRALPENIAQKIIAYIAKEKEEITQKKVTPGTAKYLKLADDLLVLNQIEQALQLIGNLPMPTALEQQLAMEKWEKSLDLQQLQNSITE